MALYHTLSSREWAIIERCCDGSGLLYVDRNTNLGFIITRTEQGDVLRIDLTPDEFINLIGFGDRFFDYNGKIDESKNAFIYLPTQMARDLMRGIDNNVQKVTRRQRT
jgi:hypothetical protein